MAGLSRTLSPGLPSLDNSIVFCLRAWFSLPLRIPLPLLLELGSCPWISYSLSVLLWRAHKTSPVDFIHQILGFGDLILYLPWAWFRMHWISVPFGTWESSRKIDTQVKGLRNLVGPGFRFGKRSGWDYSGYIKGNSWNLTLGNTSEF